ncbi:MAG: hypothetical protein F6K19_13205 [Cyanothece sp. SIO1E1]|nr:hypothetical protein [Cyanothece sp. SIO1E1]
MGHHPTVNSTVANLLKHQTGKCTHFGLYFFPDDLMEIHHMDRNHNNHKQENLVLLHRHCHDQVHAKCV